MTEQTTPYRRSISPVEAAIMRAFCAHHRCAGMAGAALGARGALAMSVESEAGGDRLIQAARLRAWAAVLTAAAQQMEAADAD